MSKVKYFINCREPDATLWADQMRVVDIDFSCVPTSGCSVLWIDGRAHYGPTAVGYAIDWLLKHPKGFRYGETNEVSKVQ